jgi:hypothetical protein
MQWLATLDEQSVEDARSYVGVVQRWAGLSKAATSKAH